MNRQELQELFTNALKEKLVGTKHSNRRIIVDVSVDLETVEADFDDNYNYNTYETIRIRVKTSSPKGRVSKWSYYY